MNANHTFTSDSNIFIYSLDLRDDYKHRIAARIMISLLRREGTIALQCLNESYSVCARKPIVSLDKLRKAISEAQASLKVVPASSADLEAAITLHQQYPLQFFDALLIATASRAGCSLLLSEDMQDGQTYGSVTVRNPFKLSTAELTTLLS